MLKMLIVDDERVGREGLLHFIDWREYNIEIAGLAANGKEALELFETAAPDIVLTDIKMPLMNGIELAEHIRAQNREVKIVLLSAYSEFEYAQRALKTGVNDYLLKPVEEAELRQVMAKIAFERLESRQKQDARHYFMQALKGDPALARSLQGSRFQVFLPGGRKGLPAIDEEQLFWLLDYYEGSQVGIVRKEPHDWGGNWLEELKNRYDAVYCGRPAERLEDMMTSYNEAVFARYIGTYWDISHLDYGWIEKRRQAFEKYEEAIHKETGKLAGELQSAIRSGSREETAATVRRTLHYLRQNQGVDPHYIEEILVRLLQQAAAGLVCRELEKGLDWDVKRLLQGQERFASLEAILLEWANKLAGRLQEQEAQIGTSVVRKVIRIIEQEYNKDISLRMIADRVYVSPNYLGVIFKQSTGTYFNDYLADYRMQKAGQLLAGSTEKVTAVSEAVGIPNSSYFSSLFKKYYGMTPKEYRRNHTGQSG